MLYEVQIIFNLKMADHLFFRPYILQYTARNMATSTVTTDYQSPDYIFLLQLSILLFSSPITYGSSFIQIVSST